MKKLIIILLSITTAGSLITLHIKKEGLENKMRALCATDGGSKIFEKIRLPKSRFDSAGELTPIASSSNQSSFSERFLGPNYYFEETTYILQDGEPFERVFSEGRLAKHVNKIIRKIDGKVLAQKIWYVRTGSEFTPFGRPSTTECPNPQENIVKQVFVKVD